MTLYIIPEILFIRFLYDNTSAFRPPGRSDTPVVSSSMSRRADWHQFRLQLEICIQHTNVQFLTLSLPNSR
ncbi:hypothetical protein ACTXT7_000068 [Hymenolepis weldensis]